MTSGVKYDVDPSEVRALAAGLRRVHQRDRGAGRPPAGPPEIGSVLGRSGRRRRRSWSGSRRPSTTLGRGWSRARAGVGDATSTLLSRAARTAAEAYAAADDGADLVPLAGR